MTSVAVISSAVTRIKCLKELLKQSESLPHEADDLLKGLQEIKESLVAATEAGAELEKEIVRHSYEIVDAIADASFKLKEKFSVSKLTHRKKTGNPKLEELQGKLNGFRDELTKITASPGEKKTGSEQNPESSTSSPGEKHKEKFSASRLIQRKKTGVTMLKKENPAPPAGSEQKPVGSEIPDVDLLHRIREEFLNPSSDSSEVYIVGKGGMGKSTLARKLFHDPEIRMKFDVFGWVPINQNFLIKGVLQVLLQQLGPRRQQQLDIREMNEIELIGQIFDQLKNKSYLIVLDDVGAMDDWDSIRLALPFASSNRVIITTSSDDFDREAHCYRISGLTQPEILRLLEEEASFKPGSEKVGKAIFDISGGSPLLATILGKSLQSEAAATATEQQLLHELDAYKPHKGTPQVLGACYKRLAPELKPCLLYMGQFPQGQDIEVEKLYLLLTAENLLSPKDSKISPQTFKEDLDTLACLKFVQVQKDSVSSSKLYKSCRLHDQVREFCKLKGSDEEFLEIVELGSSTKVGPHTRRLAVYLSKYRAGNYTQFISHGTVKKILSILIFDSFESAEKKSGWPPEIHDLTELSHLRVLHFDGVNFKHRRFPKGVDRLVLLRYLSFRGCWLEELPSSMSHLTQLETLDLVVRAECKMLIPNNILTNMKRMVHLYLPRLYHSNGKSKLQLQAMERLEILVNFDTEIFDVEALYQLKNLKILSTISRGHSAGFDAVINFLKEGLLQRSSVEITSFDCYNRASVSALRKLLQCQFVHKIQIEGQIGELPKEDESCGERIAEIVLDGSQLEHNPMSYLGKFQNLRSLVLSNDAYLGSQIVISAVNMFPNLRSLKLQNLQYLEKLMIDEGAVPELSALQIDSCGRSLELSIPKNLRDRLNGENGSYAYSVTPLPSNVNITPYDQLQESGSSVRAIGGGSVWKSSPI